MPDNNFLSQPDMPHNLILKSYMGMLEPGESQQLEEWKSRDNNLAVYNKLMQEYMWEDLRQHQEAENKETTIEELAALYHSGRKVVQIRWLAAAAMLLAISTALYFLWPNENQQVASQDQPPADTLTIDTAAAPVPAAQTVTVTSGQKKPGGNRAILVLANGNEIDLEKWEKGKIIRQGDMELTVDNGVLIYKGELAPGYAKPMINKIITPKGGQFQVQLADGSKIWLNVASAASFSPAFTKDQRRVDFTGELFFDVKKDPAREFVANVVSGKNNKDKYEVAVKGTSFNVKAYDSTPVTTVVKGNVLVSRPGIDSTPQKVDSGSQVVIDSGKLNLISDSGRLEEAIAWKNGMFTFNNTSFHEMIKVIMDWYDVEVKYLDSIPPYTFSGSIARSSNLEDMLPKLTYAGSERVEMKIVDSKLIISVNK